MGKLSDLKSKARQATRNNKRGNGRAYRYEAQTGD